jgi:hypothetical protein
MTFDPKVLAGSSGSLARWILSAQQASLSHDQRLDTLALDSLTRGVPDLPIAEAVTRAEVTLTIVGSSTVEIDVHDPEWLIERSGFLDPDSNGRLNTAAIAIDGLTFRLAAARRQNADTLTLVFEDEAKQLLDSHNKHVHVSRNKRTRAEFIGALIAEIKDKNLVYISPEESRRQLVKHPDLPKITPRDSGFDAGTTFKIKNQTADLGQMRNVAIVMTICDQLQVTERVRLAALVAGIGESEFRAIANRGGSDYGGVFQGKYKGDNPQFKLTDTEGMARAFLQGGKGFQGGGAIALAAAHPDWSAGHIAYVVEGSRSNFSSDSAAEAFYQGNHAEAKQIAGLWKSGTGGQNSSVLHFKSFEFTRGLPGKTETSWEAAIRLADEVNWRFFTVGSVVSFVSDDWLISRPAQLVLDPLDAAGTWAVPSGLLSMPEYDQDRSKLASTVTLRAVADAWGVLPGEVVVLRNQGAISGEWITETFTFDLLDHTQATVSLIKPIPPLKEPAPEAILTDDGTETGAGVTDALKWARSKIGHYKEEFGANRGQELDALEAGFGLQGAPWCSIFATTALVHGGVNRDCRTALVADIARWAAAGTHGYLGSRATPKPGDLMLFNTDTATTSDDHVGIVEKVDRDSVTTIEGNTSAGTVTRVQRVKNTGKFVRPDYRT